MRHLEIATLVILSLTLLFVAPTKGADVYLFDITTVGSGIVSRSPDQASYNFGDSVQLEAIPDPGWIFFSWDGDLTGNVNPITVTMDANKTIVATFTQIEYSLTTDVSSPGGGLVVADKAAPYYYGDVVQLNASPSIGWSFSGWSGDALGSLNPLTVTMDRSKSITATFTQNDYFLTINISPNGWGTVAPDLIAPYHYGDLVILTPSANANYKFLSWSGDGVDGSSNTRLVTVTGNMTVAATFTQIEYLLIVMTIGNGVVNKTPDQATYHFGDFVQLTAVPLEGWSFSGWSGDEIGSQNPLTITINGNKTVTAIFTQNQYTITLNTVGSGSVSTDILGPYHFGDVVLITAIPSSGWGFSFWSGDLIGSINPASITIDGSKTITGTFTQDAFVLVLNYVGGGAVNKSPDQATYNLGDVVQLSAVPDAGWIFTGWSGGASGPSNPTSITMDGSKTVNATFTQNEYSLMVTTVGGGVVQKSPDQAVYHYGDIIQLTAVPMAGWSFSAWSEDVVGSTSPVGITIDGSKVVSATFIQNEYTLTVLINPEVGGVVNRAPSKSTYYYGETVTLSQVPNTGYSFSNWSGDGTNSGGDFIVTFVGNMAVTANYIVIGGGGGGGGGGVIVPKIYEIILGSKDQSNTNKNLGKIRLLNQNYSLPYTSHLTNASYPLSYNAETGFIFDHWEVIGNVSVLSSQSRVTNLRVNGNGTIAAIYVKIYVPVEFNVKLESREDNGMSKSLGSYVFSNSTMNPGGTLKRGAGDYLLTFNPPSGYLFYRWEFQGVIVDDISVNTATIHIRGNGSLTALYFLPRGDVKIQIKDDEGSLISNATVTLSPSQEQNPRFVGLTDSKGTIIFKDLMISQYKISVTKLGYGNNSIVVSSEHNTLVIGTISLVKTRYPLTIHVIDQTERPLSGISVTLFGGSAGWQPIVHSTDSSGRTTFEGVIQKKYYILVAGEGYSPQTMDVNIELIPDNSYIIKLTTIKNEATLQTPLSYAGVVIVASIIIGLLWKVSKEGLARVNDPSSIS